MTAAEQYLITLLDSLVAKVADIKVRYEHDEAAKLHMVEVTPNSVYHSDERYAAEEEKIFEQFVTKYPSENICFVSDDAMEGVSAPIYVKEGLRFSAFTVDKRYEASIPLLFQVTMKVTNAHFHAISAFDNPRSPLVLGDNKTTYSSNPIPMAEQS